MSANQLECPLDGIKKRKYPALRSQLRWSGDQWPCCEDVWRLPTETDFSSPSWKVVGRYVRQEKKQQPCSSDMPSWSTCPHCQGPLNITIRLISHLRVSKQRWPNQHSLCSFMNWSTGRTPLFLWWYNFRFYLFWKHWQPFWDMSSQLSLCFVQSVCQVSMYGLGSTEWE